MRLNSKNIILNSKNIILNLTNRILKSKNRIDLSKRIKEVRNAHEIINILWLKNMLP